VAANGRSETAPNGNKERRLYETLVQGQCGGGGGEVLGKNTVQVSTSSTTKPTYTVLQSNPGLHGKESTKVAESYGLAVSKPLTPTVPTVDSQMSEFKNQN
jgi:hypothetical protein